MAKFEFGFEESWFRLTIKKLPTHPRLFCKDKESVANAQTLLRIGSLKVGAAGVWAQAANIIYKKKNGEYELTPFGKLIAILDPDLEEDGIWWAIHYNLARYKSDAWFYAFYINLFEQKTSERASLETEIRNYWDKDHKKPMTDSTFDKLIFPPFKQVFDGTRLGHTFGLFKPLEENKFARVLNDNHRVPHAILCYALTDWSQKDQRQSAHISKLLEPWGPGRIFGLNRETLDNMLIEIADRYQKKVAWISHTANLNSVSILNVSPLVMLSTFYHEMDGKEPLDAFEAAISPKSDEGSL